MGNILVVAELAEGKVRKATLSAVAFARSAAAALGCDFDILVMGHNAPAAAADMTGFGAARVLVADTPGASGYVCEQVAPTVAEVGKTYSVLVATATAFGKDLIPRVAAKLGAGYAADVCAVSSEAGSLLFKRPMFAGNAYGIAKISTAVQTVTVRQSEFAPAQPSAGVSPCSDVQVQPPGPGADRIEFVSFDQVKSARPELTDARVIVSGGRGVKDKFEQTLGPLADLFGAAVGATRAACDAGYAPPDIQVGQTGKIVAPELYLAFGISGAIQHLAGMKSSKVIVAVNKDPEAPIFQVADYGLVGDLFQAVPEMVERIKATR
jgi:electron transfer flavoprotein alpha subunit